MKWQFTNKDGSTTIRDLTEDEIDEMHLRLEVRLQSLEAKVRALQILAGM